MTIKSFGAKAASRSSANVGSKAKLPLHKPDNGQLRNFAATAVLAPAWMSPDYEDCYLLGKLIKLFTPSAPGVPVHLTRTQICERVFGRPVVSEEEDKKLNRAMWELHRVGVVNLRNEETGA